MPRKIDPTIKRKPDTGVLKSEMQEQHRRDIVALEAAKEMEIANADNSVTVDTGKGKLTAKPETIRHILGLRGYKQNEIENIMLTAK